MNDQDAKTKLIEAGVKLFAENGFDSTSTRDLTREAGINISLVSYYFGGKEGLYKYIIEDFATNVKLKMDELITRFDQDDFSKDSLRQTISAMIDQFLELRVQYPYISRILGREKLNGMPHTKEMHTKIFFEIGDRITGLIKKAQRKGYVRKDLNPDFFVCLLAESISAYLILHDCAEVMTDRCYKIPQQKEEFKEQLVKLFIDGVSA